MEFIELLNYWRNGIVISTILVLIFKKNDIRYELDVKHNIFVTFQKNALLCAISTLRTD